jgi:hypothetical protein
MAERSAQIWMFRTAVPRRVDHHDRARIRRSVDWHAPEAITFYYDFPTSSWSRRLARLGNVQQFFWSTTRYAQGPYQMVACRLLRRLWASADLYDKLNT